MNRNITKALFILGAILASSASHADHNSIWGEGFANMPNDIHNTRIEDDNETFMDLVQYGGGADSENRYADDTSTTTTLRGMRSGVASRVAVPRMARR